MKSKERTFGRRYAPIGNERKPKLLVVGNFRRFEDSFRDNDVYRVYSPMGLAPTLRSSGYVPLVLVKRNKKD